MFILTPLGRQVHPVYQKEPVLYFSFSSEQIEPELDCQVSLEKPKITSCTCRFAEHVFVPVVGLDGKVKVDIGLLFHSGQVKVSTCPVETTT